MEVHNVSCPNWTLPSGGWIRIDDSNILELEQNATFIPNCRNNGRVDQPNVLINHIDPFYSSVLPQMYALGTATIISYLLFIILVITPRTFFVAGRGGGGASFLGRRGMIAGSYGGASVIGVGGRPWLQKVAVLTVAVSLSIASAHTFKDAKHQYERHFMDSTSLTQKVLDSLEIRIVRVVSSTFLWLAQVQTLIRLFPRHKEKVAIKWIGFALIVLDTVFTILNNFTRDWRQSISFAKNIADAVPALNYLFELSLSLLYAAWVIFYTISKHRFAFFHSKMKNICLVAFLSMTAVLIPVIFFVLDISKPDISPWGEYIRWVGSAAASVVVWEWVERIEALERDERKDGILGREIFDGDDTLDGSQSREFDLGGGKGDSNYRRKGNDSSGIDSGDNSGIGGHRVRFSARFSTGKRFRKARGCAPEQQDEDNHSSEGVDRSGAPSADSTIYRVKCRSLSLGDLHSLREENEGELDLERGESSLNRSDHRDMERHGPSSGGDEQFDQSNQIHLESEEDCRPNVTIKPSTSIMTRGLHFLSALNIFKRSRTTPPPEIVNAQRAAGINAEEAILSDDRSMRVTFDAGVHLPTSGGSHPSTRRLQSFRSSRSADDKPLLPVTVNPTSQASSSRGDPAVSNTSSSVDILSQRGVRTEQQTSGLPVVTIPARPRRPKQQNPHTGQSSGAFSRSDLPLVSEAVNKNNETDLVRGPPDLESQNSYRSYSYPRRQPQRFPSFPDHHHHLHHYHQEHRRQASGNFRVYQHPSLSNDDSGLHASTNHLTLRSIPTIDSHDYSQHCNYRHPATVEREVSDDTYDDDDPGNDADASVQVIHLATSMSSLFSDESDEGQGEEQNLDTELHMPVPQPPPLAYQAANTHRLREHHEQPQRHGSASTDLEHRTS